MFLRVQKITNYYNLSVFIYLFYNNEGALTRFHYSPNVGRHRNRN